MMWLFLAPFLPPGLDALRFDLPNVDGVSKKRRQLVPSLTDALAVELNFFHFN